MKRSSNNGRNKPLQRELNRLIGELPLAALMEMLPDKLTSAGIEPKPKLVKALATHLIRGRGSRFSWKDNAQGKQLQKVKLTFTDEDAAKLDAMIDRFGESFPTILEESSQKSARLLLGTLQARWPDERKLQQEEDRGFRERLEQRWGAASKGFVCSSRFVVRRAGKRTMNVFQSRNDHSEMCWFDFTHGAARLRAKR